MPRRRTSVTETNVVRADAEARAREVASQGPRRLCHRAQRIAVGTSYCDVVRKLKLPTPRRRGARLSQKTARR